MICFKAFLLAICSEGFVSAQCDSDKRLRYGQCFVCRERMIFGSLCCAVLWCDVMWCDVMWYVWDDYTWGIQSLVFLDFKLENWVKMEGYSRAALFAFWRDFCQRELRFHWVSRLQLNVSEFGEEIDHFVIRCTCWTRGRESTSLLACDVNAVAMSQFI
jgi:hypothetical protein